MRKRHIFLMFFTAVSLMVVGVLIFLQSPSFANLVKDVLARRLPGDLGVQGDFSEFRVGLVPPGVSIRNPRLSLGSHNVLGLPPGSTVHADRLDLRFQLFQLFSGSIRVNEVAIVNGDVKLILQTGADKKAKSEKEKEKKPGFLKTDFHWDELFQVRVEALSIENTKLRVEFADAPFAADFVAKTLRVGQWTGPGGLGYDFVADVSDIRATGLKNWAPGMIDHLKGSLHVNALGVQMDDLTIVAGGMSAVGSGAVRGNILQPKNLMLDASVDLKGPVGSALKLGGEPTKDVDADGDLAFKGKVKGNLDRLAETIKLEGLLDVENARYQKWRADHVLVDASWSVGEVVVNKVELTEREAERNGGDHPGDGGKVEIASFKLPLPPRSSFTVPVKLDRVHPHWLGSPVLKDVFPLDFRASGTASVTYVPGTKPGSWSLQNKLALSVPAFQLDNQRLGKQKPMKKVLAVKELQLTGAVNVDSTALTVSALTLTLARTQLTVNGKIDYKTGYDLNASGPVDFADFGQMADNDITGKGSLVAHVHGPTKRVFLDFDVDLKEASYLHLNFGDIRGRITWDDDPQFLVFTKMLALKNKTQYEVNGKLDLGPGIDTADLDVQVSDGDIQDFTQIFSNLTQPLWWFPHSLTGDMKGSLKVTGGLALDELQVAADLNGSNWEFAGERLRVVAMHGGYDKGRYYISDFSSIKQSGKIFGHLDYSKDARFDWEFHTQDLTLSDLDHLARLDVPFRGRLRLDTKGSGKGEQILSSTSFSLTEAAVRGASLPSSDGSIKTEGGIAQVKGSVGGGQALLDAVYDFRNGGESSFHSELKKFDFSPVLLLLNSKSMQDSQLLGYATGSATLKFRTGEPERINGQVDITQYVLGKTGAQFGLDHPVSFKINEGSFSVTDLALRYSGGGSRTVLSLDSRKGALNGRVTGDLDLSFAQFLTSTIASTQGVLDLDYTISGTLKEPKFSGKSEIDGGTVKIASLDSPFENVAGTFLLKQNLLTVQGFQADLAGGRVTADGNIEVHADHYPTIHLKGVLSGSKIKVYPFQYAKIRGNLNVDGDERPYLVSGTVNVDQAVSHEKVFNHQQGGGLKTAQYTPPPTAQRAESIPLFKLKIDANAERGIIIQNDLFDAEAGGRMTVVGTLETPRILGNAEVISGKIQFKDRQFQIQTATANFDNPTVIDPVINLTANTEMSTTKIQLVVSGRLSTMKIDLSSNPPMGDSDILSLLAGGTSTSAVNRIYQTDRTAMQQAEAGSLILDSLDFNREVQSKTGIQIQMDESVNTLQGQSLFRPGNTVDTSSSPKIVIKRQLTPKLGVSYGSTVGVGSNKQNEVDAEYQLTPAFSLLGVWDYFETVDTKTTQTSYGADLKLQKRFK